MQSKENRVVFIIAVVFVLTQVHANYHCPIGTCYSGRLFPEPQDIFHGKHLKGFSYKNITTDNPSKCYSSCTQDCRCKACQMKDARCELLDEDKGSRADNFVVESGYVYYDLKQTLFKGGTHMVPHDKCENGCCRSQPCMNGGTCIEKCHSPKKKFKCQCAKGYGGFVCETKLISCMTMVESSRTFPKDGVYWIGQEQQFPVYCSFEQNLTRAWTLIESFAFEKRAEFRFLALYLNYSPNENIPPSWDRFRLGEHRRSYIRSKSSLFRSTCDFPKRNGTLIPDLLVGRLSDVDITTFKTNYGYGACKKFMFIDVRGHSCRECTALTVQHYGNNRHFYIDVTLGHCQFKPTYVRQSTDSFGYYYTFDTVSKCTALPSSTTQWWLGEEQ